MDQRQSQDLFLGENPTFEQRWQALRLNIQTWYERLAQAAGEEVVREDGLMWTVNHLTIAAVDARHINGQLDRTINWYHSRHPLHGAVCWYLAPTPPADLAVCLFARGFEPNWQPHWMWCDLHHFQLDISHSPAFTIEIVEDEPAWQVDDLPNYDVQEAASIVALARVRPRRIWHLAAFQLQQIVGHCTLHVTTGERGIAGLFNMGVIPSARNQGIGTALTQSACTLAQQIGCHHVVLNATPMGEPVYRRVGFQSMGYGHTWLLSERTLSAPAPSADQVTFLEAIGHADIVTLDSLSTRLEDSTIHEPSLNGLTPLDIAVRCQQPASASWLVEHGARLDLLSAWDLGWKEQIPTLLAEHPELVNLQRGQWHATPLHIAVERGDVELVKLLLTVPNDLTLKDAVFKSTASGWAHHFGHPEIIALIEQHLNGTKSS